MTKIELTEETQKAVRQRQNEMCCICGKKYSDSENEKEFSFIKLNPSEISEIDSNIALICNQCNKLPELFPIESKFYRKYFFYPYLNYPDYSSERILEDINSDLNFFENISKPPLHQKGNSVYIAKIQSAIRSNELDEEKANLLIEKTESIQKNFSKLKKEAKEALESVSLERFTELKAKIEENIANIGPSSDLKQAREFFIDAQNELKNLSLKKDSRDEILQMLNQAFEMLNRMQTDEREAFEMECIENYHNIKGKIDSALAFFSKTTDLFQARKSLLDVQSEFKGLKLKKEQREEQYARIQFAFEELNKRQEEDKEVYEKECADNLVSIRAELDDVFKFAEEAIIFKEAREKLINLQNKIKEIKLKRENRDELFAEIRTIFENLNKRQDEERLSLEKDSEVNIIEVKPIVDDAISHSKTATYFKEARENLMNAQDEVRTRRLKKEIRDELLTELKKAFSELNLRQETERTALEKETEDNYAMLKVNVSNACDFAFGTQDFQQARETLISVQNTVKTLKLKKEQREELMAQIRACFEDVIKRQDEERTVLEEESSKNFPILSEKIENIILEIDSAVNFREIREKLIAVQNETKILNLKRQHRNHLFERIREAFAIYDDKQSVNREIIKQEHQEKLVLILSNLRDKMSRLNDSIQRDEEAMLLQKTKLSEVKQDEREERIKNDINNRIDSIQKRLDEKNTSMADIKQRIENIQRELGM